MPKRRAMVGAASAAIVVLGGCTSGDDAAPTGAPSGSGSSSSSWAPPEGVPVAREWMERPALPLDYYADEANQADHVMSDIANQDGGVWEVKQEEFIAACMKEAGFTYYPREVEPAAEGESPFGSGSGAGRRLWVPQLPEDLADAERYGYGYSRPTESIDQAPTSASGEPNRNEEYVASLSPSAQKQYRVALMGKDLAEYHLVADIDTVALPEMGGCMGAASEAHPYPMMDAMAGSPTTLYEGLLDQMNEAGWPYNEGYLGRAELDALDASWRECFHADFPAVPIQPGDGDLVGTVEFVSGEDDGPAGAWNLAFHTNQDGEYFDGDIAAAPAEYSSLTGTPREVAIAVADFKCRAETDYVDRFLAIQREAQEEFIAAHKSELDEMAAALEAYINGG